MRVNLPDVDGIDAVSRGCGSGECLEGMSKRKGTDKGKGVVKIFSSAIMKDIQTSVNDVLESKVIATH